MPKYSFVIFAAAMALGATTTGALADRCSGHNHTAGTLLGAAGGGLIGNAVSHGNAIGTIGGAVIGGFAGNAIARDANCREDRYHHAYFYDRSHHRHYVSDRDERYYYDHHDRRYRDRDDDDYR